MARTTELLNAIKVKNAKRGKLHADGGGLYLKVTDTGSRSWVFRYKRNGKVRDMGLGNADVEKVGGVALARARKLAGDARQKLLDGIDPLDEKKVETIVEQDAGQAQKGNARTFKECAKALIESKQGGWKNEKHRAQWRSTLEVYAYPHMGHLPVAEIDTSHVLEVLQQQVPVARRRKKGAGGIKKAPLWEARAETATRLRARIEAVLSSAKALGWRSGENPARWADHLAHILPAQPRGKRVKHHPALPYAELPGFMARLRANTSISARALELVILTATRTGEVLNAPFSEFDLKAKMVWVVPARRTKGGKAHEVPLSPRAVEIVEEMADVKLSAFVFPGVKSGKPLTDMALTMLTRGMRPGITNHGFRSAFKDWCIEQTDYPDHVSEAALAHVSADKVRAAYARSNLFEKRRKLMEEWADFCAGCGKSKAEAPAAALETV